MFYVIYVLAILCGTGFSLKIHKPSMGMVLANQAVPVRWSRQRDSDPTSVLFLLENLIGGGNKTQLVNGTFYGVSDTTTQMTFPDVGTFRMWAVNPADPSQSYAMSKTFTVMPNSVAAVAGAGDATTPGATGSINNDDEGQTTECDDNIPLCPPPSGSADSASTPASAATPPPSNSPSSSKTPLIVGAAVGGVVLLLLLIFLTLFLIRRRNKAKAESKRTTFNRNRMVKSLPPPTFAVPREADMNSDIDDEKEVGMGEKSYYNYGYGHRRNGSGAGYGEWERGPTAGVYPFARAG